MQEALAHLDQAANLDHREALVVPELPDLPVNEVHLARGDPLACLEELEDPVREDNQDRADNPVLQVQLVHLDSQDLPVLPEELEDLEREDPRVRLDLLDHQDLLETEDQTVSEDLPARLDLLDNQVSESV